MEHGLSLLPRHGSGNDADAVLTRSRTPLAFDLVRWKGSARVDRKVCGSILRLAREFRTRDESQALSTVMPWLQVRANAPGGDDRARCEFAHLCGIAQKSAGHSLKLWPSQRRFHDRRTT
jgi:hypothetical protein